VIFLKHRLNAKLSVAMESIFILSQCTKGKKIEENLVSLAFFKQGMNVQSNVMTEITQIMMDALLTV